MNNVDINSDNIGKTVFSKSVSEDITIKVPPINLMNVDLVNYLFWNYPYLIKTGLKDEYVSR